MLPVATFTLTVWNGNLDSVGILEGLLVMSTMNAVFHASTLTCAGWNSHVHDKSCVAAKINMAAPIDVIAHWTHVSEGGMLPQL